MEEAEGMWYFVVMRVWEKVLAECTAEVERRWSGGARGGGDVRCLGGLAAAGQIGAATLRWM